MFWKVGFLVTALAVAMSAIDVTKSTINKTDPFRGLDANGKIINKTELLRISNIEGSGLSRAITDINDDETHLSSVISSAITTTAAAATTTTVAATEMPEVCKPTTPCIRTGGNCIKGGAKCDGTVKKKGCKGGKKCKCCIPEVCKPATSCTVAGGNCIKGGATCDGTMVKISCKGGKKCKCCIPEVCKPTTSCTVAGGNCIKGGAKCDGSVDKKGCKGGKKCKCCIPAVCPSGCGNGHCSRPDTCTCNSGWLGSTCNLPVCHGGCGNGNCSRPNTCTCNSGWLGSTCNTPVCPSGCGNGHCSSPNTCTCKSGWSGSTCETQLLTYYLQSSFEVRWTDQGTGGDHDLSCWRIKPSHGYCSLGDICISAYELPSGMEGILVPQSSLAQHPRGFSRIWDDQGSGSKTDGSMWTMIPEFGYTCLGDVSMPEWSDEPVRTEYCCIRSDFIVSAAVNGIYNDKGTGAWSDLSIWTIIQSGSSGIANNNFLAVNGYSAPSGAKLLNDQRAEKGKV